MTGLTLAAVLAALLLAAVALFQVTLALGAPYGAYAWGGKTVGRLPDRLRLGSAISAPLLVAMAVIVLIRGGFLWPELRGEMDWPVWVIFLFMVMNTGANWRSASARERRTMTPVTAAIAVLLLCVQFLQPGAPGA